MQATLTRKRWKFIVPGFVLCAVAAGPVMYALLDRSKGSPVDTPVPETKTGVNEQDAKSSDSGKVPITLLHSDDRLDAQRPIVASATAVPLSPQTNQSLVLEYDGIKHDVQSPARPFGLDIVAPVQMGGTDQASVRFMADTLPDILDYIESNIVHSSTVEDISAEANPSNLALGDPSNIRIYFVGEEAAYHNSIGVNFDDDSGSMLLFPDASSAYSYNLNGDARHEYTSEKYPLMPGDFIDLGTIEPGSFLDFFIIPNGAHQATEAYGIDKTLNEDNTVHARVLGVVGDSIVVLGFEDIKHGGDRDYDDVIIAVDVGVNNLNAISSNFGM